MNNPELYQTNNPDYYLKLITLSEPKSWTKLKVEIYNKNDEKIGEYGRNYSFLDTFWVFTHNKETYALYSTTYTATRVMKLVDGKFVDWCGEENDANGFCPVEFYVPSIYKSSETEVEGVGKVTTKYKDHEEYSWHWKEDAPFGFVAGCFWGDDSSWKVQYLDLSQIGNKILVRKELFGYIALGGNLKLKDSIEVSDRETSEDYIISIAVQNHWRINNHKLMEKYDD